MSTIVPNTVRCSVTGVEHIVVHGEVNKNKFNNYLHNLKGRMDNNEHVNIAIDCEGWVLGVKRSSLGMIQMAECFTEHILDRQIDVKNGEKVSLNLKPGFIVKTPIDPTTIALITSVFTHKNITLITFDFTADLAAMNEIGIGFNPKRIIDSQPCTKNKGKDIFTNITSNGLKSVCLMAKNCVEYEAAKNALNNKKTVDFNEKYVMYNNNADPFSASLNDEFWKYAADDVALTAMALVARLSKYIP